MTPWMVLVLVSRKVNGMPVGVAPTLKTLSSALAPSQVSKVKRATTAIFRNGMRSPSDCARNGQFRLTRPSAPPRSKIWHGVRNDAIDHGASE
jgi:hypothetical protein